jgi:hypothetical protein
VARSRPPFHFDEEADGGALVKEGVPKSRRGTIKAATAVANGHAILGLKDEKKRIMEGGNDENASTTVDTNIPHVM